eukprot:159497_1
MTKESKHIHTLSTVDEKQQDNINSINNLESSIILKKSTNILKKSDHNKLQDVIKEYEQIVSNMLQPYNDKKLQQKIKRRINKFIFIPGIAFPYQHIHKINRNNHMDLKIYLTHLRDSKMLLRLCKETIRLTSKQKKGNNCPIPIFIPTNDNYFNFNKKHMLSTYSSKIINELQLCLEFHVSSHGYRFPLGIDSINPFKRLTPRELAIKFHQMFVKYKLVKNIQSKNMIKFIFHICNGAFCNIESNDTKQDIVDKIRNESFIGMFWNTMNVLGYNNIMVIGYRGFYATMSSGSGIRIGNRLVKPTVDIDAKQVEYVIYANGEVNIPKNYDFKLLNCKYASSAA